MLGLQFTGRNIINSAVQLRICRFLSKGGGNFSQCTRLLQKGNFFGQRTSFLSPQEICLQISRNFTLFIWVQILHLSAKSILGAGGRTVRTGRKRRKRENPLNFEAIFFSLEQSRTNEYEKQCTPAQCSDFFTSNINLQPLLI